MKQRIKTSILASALLLMGFNAHSQNMYDAYMFSQQNSEGTARSVSMGNAFTALGGDLGAISINPASSGVYRYSEISITPSLTIAMNNTDYLNNKTSDSKTRFGVANFGYVGSFNTGRQNTGLINWNIAVTFNKMNNFTSRMSASGRTAESSWLSSLANNTNGIISESMDMTDDDPMYPFYNSNASWSSILGWNTSLLNTLPDSDKEYYAATENLGVGPNGNYIKIGGILDQRYTREILGNVSEAVINFGGNFSNKLFFGVNIGIQSIWYKHSEMYSETALSSQQFNEGFEHFSHRYNQSTTGTGVNLKAGLIYLPFAGLRLGASISTPTWMYLHNEWDESMTSQFNDGYNQHLESPLGIYDYRINTPFRWNVGAAYTFKKMGAISVDYENVKYSGMKMIDPNYPGEFNDENSAIKRTFTSSNILRAGLEIKLVPEIALRAGYQYYSSGIKGDTYKAQYGSLGLGYQSKNGIFADIAYKQKLNPEKEEFSLYSDVTNMPAPVGTAKNNDYRIMLTLGLRF